MPNADLFEYLLRLGDDALVLGHRLSEWCGHGPMLEEDIALANIALDLVGQANAFLTLAGEVEGQGRDEDALAFHRDTIDYRNLQICELPRGDFAFTIARQFLFSVFAYLRYEALTASTHETVAGIAGKALKEARYHLRHSAEWMLRLGDGTDESHRRLQSAIDDLWMYTGELFATDDLDARLAASGLAPDVAALRPQWRDLVVSLLEKATLTVPEDAYMLSGGRQGRHTEHLGFLLAEMQILPRSLPEATW